jgi:hypothetical protein
MRFLHPQSKFGGATRKFMTFSTASNGSMLFNQIATRFLVFKNSTEKQAAFGDSALHPSKYRCKSFTFDCLMVEQHCFSAHKKSRKEVGSFN